MNSFMAITLRCRGHPDYDVTVDRERQVRDLMFSLCCMASDRVVARLYMVSNGATAKDDSEAFATYTNPNPHAGLQRVVGSKLPDAEENFAQAFQNVWKTV